VPFAEPPTCPICGAELPREPAIRGVDRLLGTPGEYEVLVCAACGSGITSPFASEDELGAYYGSTYGSHGEPSGGVYARVFAALKRAQVARLLRRAPFSLALAQTHGRALDVGCARGDLAAGLIARGWSVDGLEPSAAAAELASGRGVRVLGQTLSRAPLAPQAYDLVVLRHSLEHLPDPLADMRRVAGALRAGGRVVISLPNFASWQRALFGSRWFHLDLPRHRVHFTPASLRSLLERSGLAVTAELTSTSVLGLPASVQYAIVGRCLAPGGLALRAAAAACVAVLPLTWLADRVGGERDTLHIVAERSS
jgi:SAM-dependent methyltransferase